MAARDAAIAAGRPNWVEQGIGEKLTYWMTYHQSYVLLYVFEKNAQLVDTQFGVPVILNDEQLVRDIDVHPRILADHLGRQHLVLPAGGTGHAGVSFQAGRERGVDVRLPGHQLPGWRGRPGPTAAAMRRGRAATERRRLLTAGAVMAVAIVAGALIVLRPGSLTPPPVKAPSHVRKPSHVREPSHVRTPAIVPVMGVVEFDSSPSDAGDPVLAAGELHFYWSQIEPRPGVFDWQRVNDAMQPWVAAGKQVVLRISAAGDESWSYRAGHATPAWVYAAGVASITTSNGSVLPVYWGPSFERDWGAFIAAMARRYDGDPHIAYVEAGIGEGGETLAETETNDPERTARSDFAQRQAHALVRGHLVRLRRDHRRRLHPGLAQDPRRRHARFDLLRR